MKVSRGSAAFRSLCGDWGAFDARIVEEMGWNGIGWHDQSMFINDDQYRSMLVNVGQCWSMLVNVDGVDQCRWVVTSVDQCWSMLVNVGHCQLILINVGQCWPMLTNLMLLRTAKSLEKHRSLIFKVCDVCGGWKVMKIDGINEKKQLRTYEKAVQKQGFQIIRV